MNGSLGYRAVHSSVIKALTSADRGCTCYEDGVHPALCGYKCWKKIPIHNNPAQIAFMKLYGSSICVKEGSGIQKRKKSNKLKASQD